MKFFIEMRESVINFKFYNDIRKNRYGKVFGYLALLMLLVYILLGVSTYIYANKAIESGIYYIKNEMPEFSVANGELDWKGQPQQFLIQNSGLAVAVDINNTLDEAALDKEYVSYFVFTKDHVIAKNAIQKKNMFYKEMNAAFSKNDLVDLLGTGRIVIIVLTVLFFPFYYAIKLLNVLLLAIAAAISAAILKLKISWRENFIISGYALTLPTLLMLLFTLAGYGFPTYAYWIISVLYVIMAQRYIRLYELAVFEAERVNELAVKEAETQILEQNRLETEEQDRLEIEEHKSTPEKTEDTTEKTDLGTYKVSDGSDTKKKEED